MSVKARFMKKRYLPYFKPAISLMTFFLALVSYQPVFSQTTLVDYDFNSGGSFAALAPTLATGITSAVTGSAAFGTAAGVASGANAFTANATAGNALTSAPNNTWTFTLGGTSLPNYSTFKIYFQAERNAGGANTVAISYSYNGGAYSTTGIASTAIGGTTYGNAYTLNLGNPSGTWYEAIFTLPAAANNPTSLAFQLTIGNGGTGNVQLDNFEVQADPPCAAPTAQPTALALTPASTTSISGSFTAASPAPTGYLVVRSASATLSANPVNGTTYTTGGALGGGTVVQESAATTFTATGLTANTLYYFFIFSYNNTGCAGGPDYYTTGSLTGNSYPECAAANAPTALTFPANTNSSIGGSFTAATGGVSGYLVIESASATLTSGPVNGTNYTTGSALGGGTVIQTGTGTTFTFTPATPNTLYYFFVYAYRTGGACGTAYSAQLTNSSYTECQAPTAQPTALTLTPASTTSIAGSFTAASPAPTGYLVVRSTATTLSANPVNGTTYVAGGALGGGTVIQASAATTFTATGLATNTLYHFFIFSYNNTTCSGGPIYFTTGPLTGSSYPECAASNAPTALTFPANTGTSIGGSFTAATGGVNGYLVIESTSATLSSGPVTGTNYTTGNTIGGGTVIQTGTGTTFTYTPASANTLYYFFIYAYRTGGACGTSYSAQLTNSSYTECQAPAAQPTALVLTPASTTSIAGSFTAVSPAPTGYLVVRSTSATLSANPVNGTTYAAGGALGGGTVVQTTAATTFTATGLTANTLYYFFIFSYNNTTCAGGPIYYTTGPLTGSYYPECAASNAPTALTFPANTGTSIGGSFTAATGGVNGYLVIESASATLSAGPVAGTNYITGSAIGGGTVIQVAAATTFTFTPATPGTLYYFFVYAYRTGAACGTSYSAQLTNSSYTACQAPTSQPTALMLTTPNSTSITGSFTDASPLPSGYLVVRTTSSTAPTNPVNGTTYTAGAAALGGTIIAVGSSTSFTDNGLTGSTTYWYWIYSYNNTTCTGGPLYYTTSPLSSSATTLSQKNWVGAGAGGTSTDFNLATNWAPAVSPAPGDNLVMNINNTTSGYIVALSANTSVNSLAVTYSTALTASSNWTLNIPSTFTLATTSDITVTNNITSTSGARTGTLNISVAAGGTLTVGGNLTVTASTSNRRKITAINNSGTLTVTGTTLVNNFSTNGVSNTEFLNASGAITTFSGAVTLDDNTSTSAVTIGALTNGATGEFDFQNDLTLGPRAAVNAFFTAGTVLFDAPASQTITDNIANPSWNPGNITIGSVNNPTVTLSLGTGTSGANDITAQTNLTLNGSSVLILPAGETINNYSNFTGGAAAGALSLNGTAAIELGDITNGQTGSNFPAGFATVSLNTGSTVEYDGTAAQTVYSAPAYGNLTIGDATLLPASNTTAGGALTLAGNLLINTGAGFATGGYSHLVQGNWTNNGTFTAGAGSTVSFGGNATETIGGSSGSVFNNLTINQGSGGSVSLAASGGVTVGGVLTLTNGIVTSSATYPLTVSGTGTTTGASVNSYVSGPVIKTGSSDFVFPVGKTGTGYVPIAIANLTGSTTFTAEYIRSSATKLNASASYVSGLSHVSNCEYWTLEQSAGSATADITGYWATYSPCNGEILSYYINDLFTLVLAHFDGTNWNAFGPAGTATNTISNPAVNGQIGQVSWTGVSSFSPFSLGSTITDNPLPVVLVDFNASLNSNRTVGLSWMTEQEEDLSEFEVERSADGVHWTTIGTVEAKGTSALPTGYGYTDQRPLNGADYYRLRMINLKGDYVFSQVQVVTMELLNGITVFPNPANEYINVSVSRTAVDVNVKLINQLGEVMKLGQVKAGTSAILTFDIHNYAQGAYLIQVSGADGSRQTSKVMIMR